MMESRCGEGDGKTRKIPRVLFFSRTLFSDTSAEVVFFIPFPLLYLYEKGLQRELSPCEKYHTHKSLKEWKNK